MKIILLSLLLTTWSLSSTASPELKQWKARDQAFKHDRAILAAQGKGNAAKIHAEAKARELARISALVARKVLQRARLWEATRDSAVAACEAEASAQDLVTARSEKALEAATAGCLAGKAAECEQAVAAYARIFKTREALAGIAVRRAQAELDHETLKHEAIRKLVESGSLDPILMQEADLSLARRHAEVKAARELLVLAESGAGPAAMDP